MTETKNLAAALAAFQAEMPVVHKGNRANVGQYSYTYADLADVTAAAMPLLSANGLSFMSCPRQTPTGYELAGVLLHSSGERMEGALPIMGKTPQDWGSSITYMRRYLLGCMTGIVTDDDDDGRGAAPAPKRAAKKATPPPQAPPPEDRTGAKFISPITDNTRAKMFALFGELKISDPDEQRRGIAHVVGHPVESRAKLTEAEGLAVVKRLSERRAATRQEQNA